MILVEKYAQLVPRADAEQGGEEAGCGVQLPHGAVRATGGPAAHPGGDSEGLGQRGVVRCVDAGQQDSMEQVLLWSKREWVRQPLAPAPLGC